MEIRNARIEDIPDMLALGSMLWHESRYRRLGMDEIKVSSLLHAGIGKPGGIIIVGVEDGVVLGGMIGEVVEHWFGFTRFARDLALFVHPDYRRGSLALRLLKAFEQAAKDKGAEELLVANHIGREAHHLDTLYERHGMTRIGGLFFKPL